jgi:cytoskeleton protein RodZ
MKEIGAKLRAVREAKKITLAEIQERTKIRLRYLEAIESGDWEVIPGEVYRRGFICNYAHEVGLDGDALLREYSKTETPSSVEPDHQVNIHDAVAEPVVAEPPSDATSDTVFPKPQSLERRRLLVALGLIMVGIIIGIMVWSLLAGGWGKNKPVVTGKKPAVAQQASKSTIKLAGLNETNGENAQQPAATIVQQLYPAPITVYAEFSETVWIQVKADDEVKYRGSGMTFTVNSPKQLWTANREMVIRSGNPAGMRLTLNGKDLGILGERGKPRTIILNARGMVTNSNL